MISVTKEKLTKDTKDEERYLGTQEVIVRINEGIFEGQEKAITNYLSNTSNVRVSEGQRVIICVDAPINAEPYFAIFS